MIHVINFEKEKWKTIKIKNIKTNYQISNLGRCRNKITNKILKRRIHKGYVNYILYINGKQKYTLAHRLVAINFIKCPNDFDNFEVNHKDGIKTNNKPRNLEWCTGKENCLHAFKTGLHKSKFSKKTVHDVCKLLEKGYSNKEISIKLHLEEKYNCEYEVVKGFIKSIKSKRAWVWVSDNYDIPEPKKMKSNDKKLIEKICLLIQENYNNDHILDKLKLEDRDRKLIGRIRRKKAWVEISKNYNF